jgi:hypothetical protein
VLEFPENHFREDWKGREWQKMAATLFSMSAFFIAPSLTQSLFIDE